jgi:ABC-2 type transport system ATP-binding protein
MLCDRVAIIVKGRIRHEGPIDALQMEGDREVDVVLSGVAPELARRLEEHFGASLRGHGERIEARVAEKCVGDVLKGVLDAGGTIVSVTPHRVSLESIFLHAVEQEAEEAR